jgi:hypothetical protein
MIGICTQVNLYDFMKYIRFAYITYAFIACCGILISLTDRLCAAENLVLYDRKRFRLRGSEAIGDAKGHSLREVEPVLPVLPVSVDFAQA